MTDRRYRDMELAIEKEATPAGVAFNVEISRKHLKVRLTKDGKERLVVMSSSASDHRAIMNRARDVRRAVRELTGA